MNPALFKDLWYIVSQVKLRFEFTSSKHDLALLQYTIDGYKHLRRSKVIVNSAKSERFPIDAHRRMYFPPDFVDYYKIGLCINGYIINLTLNETICLAPPVTNCCGVEELANTQDRCARGDVDGLYSGWWWLPSYSVGLQFVAGMYGRGEGVYNGGYRINRAGGYIQFDNCVRANEIVMEYESTGGVESGVAYVPDQAAEALSLYVQWKAAFNSKNRELRSMYPAYKREFQFELRRCQVDLDSISPSEFLDIMRSGIMQLPKR